MFSRLADLVRTGSYKTWFQGRVKYKDYRLRKQNTRLEHGLAIKETIIILKTVARSKSFTVLFIALMVLSATSTAILLVIDYIGNETKYIASKIVFPKTPVSISINETISNRINNKSSDYVKGCLREAKILISNRTIHTNIIVLGRTAIDKLKELEGITIKIIGNYSEGIILPASMLKTIELTLNKSLLLHIGGIRREYRVIGVYSIKSMRVNIPILISIFENNRCSYTVVISDYYIDYRREVLLDTIDYLNYQLDQVVFNWLLMFSIVYTILAILLIQKFLRETLDKFKLLAIQGLNLGINITYAFFIIALIINTAGMGLGLITVDGVIWISRFLGMIFPLRPVVTIETIIVMLVYSIILSLTAFITIKSRLRGYDIV